MGRPRPAGSVEAEADHPGLDVLDQLGLGVDGKTKLLTDASVACTRPSNTATAVVTVVTVWPSSLPMRAIWKPATCIPPPGRGTGTARGCTVAVANFPAPGPLRGTKGNIAWAKGW